MKVAFALQCIASQSVGRVLTWCHSQGIHGFPTDNAIATAEFILLSYKLFDLLNSRSMKAPGYKKSLNKKHFHIAESIFNDFENLNENLFDSSGMKVTLSMRKTGPLDILGEIKSIRFLISNLHTIELSYLAPYKLCHDHLEIWFNAVSLCYGWSYNPTCKQFISAYRSRFIHGGKNIVKSSSANCTALDETVILNVLYNSSTLNYVMPTVEEYYPGKEQTDENNNSELESM
ncbi:uncharacterized protein [Lepeophtheirus salmonis]|uniref:uncharacterized protein n=1 Tax=Lepeophtheirus salmonis TaxID=72036 RepID=UPI003AF38B07